jgi:DNA-binding ferritin-like protein
MEKYSYRAPVQDLAGVRTWVKQDNVQKDTRAPEKSREDYEDGKPQRDRVLPLPDGHPKGRDEYRAGPPVSNTPSDSSGASTSYSVKTSPNAVPNQPNGKPLHQRPRSSGLPGEEYGHPYIDASKTTGLSRRTMTGADNLFFIREAMERAQINLKPPKQRQRKWRGQIKRDYEKRKRKLRTRNLSAQKQKRKRWYRLNKTKILRYQHLYNERHRLHKRYEGGGYTTRQQKYVDDKKRKRASMMRNAVKDVMSAMYREMNMDVQNILDFEDDDYGLETRVGKVVYRKGPGSQSSTQQQKQRVRTKKKNLAQVRRERRQYYKKHKTQIKRVVNKWRRKNKTKLNRYKPLKRASELFTYGVATRNTGDGNMQTSPRVWAQILGFRVASSSSEGDYTLATLQVLLAVLRGAHWAHWTSHWQVQGETAYGDHLLMGKIYEGLIGEIDTLAEKIVGEYGPSAVSAVDQAQIMANKLLPIAEMHSANDPLVRALFIEETLQRVFKIIYNNLKKREAMSLGMDDFIMSTANQHETYLYLLRQRMSER